MIRALMVIVDPAGTWERIDKGQHGIARVFLLSLLPLLLVVTALEGYSLNRWGREQGISGRARPVEFDLLLRYETAQFIFGLVLVFGGALLIKLISEGFHRRHSYREAFVTTAYSLGPLFLFRLMNSIPTISLWVPWAIGIFLAVAALYRGLPRIMKPDPSNALGVYIMAALTLILASGLMNYLAMLVLDEKILAPPR